jgi:hypothetical protein
MSLMLFSSFASLCRELLIVSALELYMIQGLLVTTSSNLILDRFFRFFNSLEVLSLNDVLISDWRIPLDQDGFLYRDF